jgi:hypothetical protein
MRALCGLLATLLVAAPAVAAPDPQRVSLGLRVGFVNPVGEVGGAVGYHLFEPFALELGAGVGTLGTHVNLMAKAFIGDGPFRLLLAAGPALFLSGQRDGYSMYGEVGVEGRTGDSLFLALAGGVAVQKGSVFPSLRLSTGVRF